MFSDGVKACQWMADAEKTQNGMSVLNLKDHPQ